MTMAEARKWAAYRNKRGSLNPGLRLEEGFARVLEAVYRAVGVKDAKADSFMPHVVGRASIEATEESSAEEVFQFLKSRAKPGETSERARKILQRREARRENSGLLGLSGGI